MPKSTLVVLEGFARLGMVAKPQNGSRGQTKVLQVRSERVVQCIICEIGVTGRFTVAPPTGKDTK